MIKQALTQLDYSMFAEVSLAIFALVFVAVTLRTLMTKNETTDRQARIVLGDKSEE